MGFRVLLVDDDGAIRAAVERVIRRMGHAVTALGEASKALSATDFDLAVVDLNLGVDEQDGLTLLRALQKNNPNARFVLTSGANLSGLQGNELDESVTLLRKPFGRTELLELFDLLGPPP